MDPIQWEVIKTDKQSLRRIAVPGGWLYQVEISEWRITGHADHPDYDVGGWTSPVFVADPGAGRG